MRSAAIVAIIVVTGALSEPLAAASSGCAGPRGLFACTADLARALTEPLPSHASFHGWLDEARGCWKATCTRVEWGLVLDHARLAAFERAEHAQGAALRYLAALVHGPKPIIAVGPRRRARSPEGAAA